MDRKKSAAINSIAGMLSMVVTFAFSFIIRKVFLQRLGLELLGVSGTFASILDTLSLAELGFQSAIIYNLYKPLYERDESRINSVIQILRKIFNCLGVLYIAASFLLLPLIKYFLKDIIITTDIYIYFLIQAWASAASYFLAYKRTLLMADQKDYISKYIDTGINIIGSLMQIVAIVVFQSMTLQLVVRLFMVIASNIFIQIAARKYYTFLKKEKINRSIFVNIWYNTKDVFFGKLAFLIYTSSDNLIISRFINTVAVGSFTNYSFVTKSLQRFVNSVLTPIAPIIGNMLVDSDTEKSERVFNIYTHLRFVFSFISIVPLLVLMDDFIINIFGQEYLLNRLIIIYMSLDLLMQIVHNGCTDYLSSLGLFKQQKDISIIGAALKVVFSIIFVKLYGLQGLLIGTLISQLFYWISFSYLDYKLCFGNNMKNFIIYWIKNIYYIGIAIVMVSISCFLYSKLPISSFILKFIAGGLVSEIVILAVTLIAFKPFKEQKELIQTIRNLLFRKI